MNNIYISGHLYNKPGIDARTVNLELECQDDFLRLANPPSYNQLYPQNGWRKSNEPEAHLDTIAIRIAKNKPRTILCTSYKDVSLAERVQSLLDDSVNISVLFDDQTGLVLKPAEECVTQPSKLTLDDIKDCFDLILCRHFLEHSPDPTSLLKYLSNWLATKGSIYIEVPTIDQFLKRKVPLFAWEQHAYYFSPKSLIRLATICFTRISILRVEGTDIEPSLCTLLTNNDKEGLDQNSLDLPGFSHAMNSLTSIVQDYKYKWMEAAAAWEGPTALLGIGHAADRFRQWTGLESKIGYLVDSDASKAGLYLANSVHPIMGLNIIRKVQTVILGVHDRDIKWMQANLRSNGFKGEILSIYDCPKV